MEEEKYLQMISAKEQKSCWNFVTRAFCPAYLLEEPSLVLVSKKDHEELWGQQEAALTKKEGEGQV